MVKHVVLFSFNFPIDSNEVRGLDQRFKQLPSLINEVADFETGVDISIENLAKGYEKAYIVSFRDEKDRDTYLVHPHHKAFVDSAQSIIKDALVFDFIPEPESSGTA